VAIEQKKHGHPAVRAGVVVVAAVLVLLLALDAVSAIVGLIWTVVKLALLAALLAGAVHIWSSRRRSHRS
jgi:hypothetical protein